MNIKMPTTTPGSTTIIWKPTKSSTKDYLKKKSGQADCTNDREDDSNDNEVPKEYQTD